MTPELEAACRKLIEGVQLGGPYLPRAYNRLRVQFPGNHGGVNWGGTSFNPQLGLPVRQHQRARPDCPGLTDRDPKARRARRAATGQGNRVDPDGPYEGVPGGGRFRSRRQRRNMMCQQPPWGQLTAVDVNTGEFAWRVPLGVTDSLPPDKQKTGRPGNGGTIATAGGLVFVGATDDARFRAFDARPEGTVDVEAGGAAHATPMHLSRQGRPAVRRHHVDRRRVLRHPVTDDSVMAFALPRAVKTGRAATGSAAAPARRPATREPGGFGVDGPACLAPDVLEQLHFDLAARVLAPPADDAAVAPDCRRRRCRSCRTRRACAGRVPVAFLPAHGRGIERRQQRDPRRRRPASSRSSGIT